MEIMTRIQAAERGLLRFYTGKPCKRGHDSERYTRTNACIECQREATTKYNQKVGAMLDEARAAEGVAA